MSSKIKDLCKSNAKRVRKCREKRKSSIMKIEEVEEKKVKIDENLTKNVFENSANTCEKISFCTHQVNNKEQIYDVREHVSLNQVNIKRGFAKNSLDQEICNFVMIKSILTEKKKADLTRRVCFIISLLRLEHYILLRSTYTSPVFLF